MTQTIHRGTDAATRLEESLIVVRGNDEYYTFTHESAAAEISRVVFTARKKGTGAEDGIGTVVMQIASDTQSAQWDIATDYEAELDFIDTNTSGLRAASSETALVYDIEMYHNDGTYYTVERGDLTVEYDVTHDDSTAAYLTWETRETYDDLLEQYVAGFDRTFLSAAGSGSDTDIDVTNGAIFSVSDDIRIILDDGTYDEVTIDTISTNNLDFSTSDPGGLSSAAAANNVVLKVV